MRSGRSLDQLFRSSIDADEDRDILSHATKIHSDTNTATEEMRIKLAQAEMQRQNIIDECNK